MEFARLFFTWWGFLVGALTGAVSTFLMSLFVVPVLYRAKRRRELRRMWQANRVRSLSDSLMPTWAEYEPGETVDRRCVCHGRRINPGEYVLLWPEVGPLGIMQTSVYCENVKESV